MSDPGAGECAKADDCRMDPVCINHVNCMMDPGDEDDRLAGFAETHRTEYGALFTPETKAAIPTPYDKYGLFRNDPSLVWNGGANPNGGFVSMFVRECGAVLVSRTIHSYTKVSGWEPASVNDDRRNDRTSSD